MTAPLPTMIESPGTTFRRVNDLTEFRRIHNRLFANTQMSMKWLTWYVNEVAQCVRMYGAYDKDTDELIGSWCVEAKQVLTDVETTISVGRCFSVGVDERYRRRNIFVNLSKYAISSEQELGEHQYVLGFPQVGRPVVDAHLKSGWYPVQIIDALAARSEICDRELCTCSVKISEFDPQHVRIATAPSSFLERAEYKLHRWAKHPENSYILLRKNYSYLVLKPYGGACHVVDLFGEFPDFRGLLLAARSLAYRHGWKEINTWCATNDDRRALFESCGFGPLAVETRPVILLAVNIKATEPFSTQKCNFLMGSEEIY